MAKQIRNMSQLVSDVNRRLSNNDKVLTGDIKNSMGAYSPVSQEDLEAAARALQEYLQKWIRHYFDNYSPSVYQRTGEFLDSVRTEVISNGSGFYARVYFDDSKVYRDSLWDGQPQSYLPAILNDGYSVKSGWHKDIHHFGYFEGARFMEAAVEEARKDSRFRNIDIVMHTDNSW